MSFLSSARALRELIDEPERRLLGGTWGLGLGSTGGLDVRPLNNLSVRTEVVLRDRVVGSVNMGIPLRASTVAYQRGSSWAIGTEASISLRHRFGHGLWSTAIELGAGMTERRTWTAEIDPDDHTMFLLDERRWLPSASARIGSGGAWLRVSALVEDDTAAWLLAVETDWPGSIGFF